MNWITTTIPGSTPESGPILSVLAKAAYRFGPGTVTPFEYPAAFVESDQYSDPGNPAVSDVVAESDMTAYKPFTDIVVIGKAHAPKGRSAYHLDCSVAVGALKKTVRVYGNRVLRPGALGRVSLSDPEPFSSQPLGYRFAYGGIAVTPKDMLVTCHTNPVGCGFYLKGALKKNAFPRVPHIEDPQSSIKAETMAVSKYEGWPETPMPVSLGWTRRDSYPRYTWAGVLPEFVPAAEQSLAHIAERDRRFTGATVPRMDMRFFQGASAGLWGGPLKGGEPVTLSYLDPDFPVLDFSLPSDKPVLTLDIGEGPKELEAVLQTVVMDVEEKVLTMLWRGCMGYGGVEELSELKKLESVAKD